MTYSSALPTFIILCIIIIGAGPQSAQLLVDPNRAQPTAGESLNLTCYIVGETNYTDVQMKWRKDGETVANSTGSMKLVLQLDTSDSSHTGVYTCEVVMDGMTLQANANVTVICKYFFNLDMILEDQKHRCKIYVHHE